MIGGPVLKLTAGERRVYDVLISSGWSNQKIGEELGLSRNTVRVYLVRIFEFYGVHERAELLAMALWPRIRMLELENRKLREVEGRAA